MDIVSKFLIISGMFIALVGLLVNSVCTVLMGGIIMIYNQLDVIIHILINKEENK